MTTYTHQRYKERIRAGLCGACGKSRGVGRQHLSTCVPCRDASISRTKHARRNDAPIVMGRFRTADRSTTSPNAKRYENDEARFFDTSSAHDDNRGTSTREREKECAEAFRVERYSFPKQGWEVVIYANPLAQASTHAQAIVQSYRLAGLTHYSHVRIVDMDGRVVAEERV